MIIFSSPGMFRQFYLPGPAPCLAVVRPYFHILPFLNQLHVDREFYILGLSEKHLHLLRYTNGECEEVPLPDGVPKNAEAAGAFNPPDHTLRDRSAAGQSSGTPSAVVFSTSSEREKAHERLREFFRLVDQGLSKVLSGQRLLLSGASYEVAIYRRAAVYPFLMEGYLGGDLHDLLMPQIARRASEHTRIQARQQAEKQLHLLREAGPERTSFDIPHILKAAEEGRVAKLILGLGEEAASGATLQGFESDSQAGLMNAAAVLSIRYGAVVFVLPASAIAPSGPVAAMFRY
jgi:hypothetical protein